MKKPDPTEPTNDSSLTTTTKVYNTIYKDGVEQLERPNAALFFSGLSGGLFICFSFFFAGVLQSMLPPNLPWANAITSLGYISGFVIVILGHMQFFNQNNITTVLPLLSHFSLSKLGNVARLWIVVFVSNMIGTALSAWLLTNPYLMHSDIGAALVEISGQVAGISGMENFIRAIPAGVLTSILVWMLPSAKDKLPLSALVAYLMALGSFSHVVVGSAQMFFSVLTSDTTMSEYFLRFLFPTALGNILGGTGIFTLLMFGQVAGDNMSGK